MVRLSPGTTLVVPNPTTMIAKLFLTVLTLVLFLLIGLGIAAIFGYTFNVLTDAPDGQYANLSNLMVPAAVFGIAIHRFAYPDKWNRFRQSANQ